MAKRGKNKEAVAIAQDVIQQIRAKRYNPVRGSYIVFEGDDPKPGDLQKQLKRLITPSKPCSVCALGASLISAVSLFDKFEVKPDMQYNHETDDYDIPTNDGEDINDGEMARRKLNEFFTTEELGRIEAIFENWWGHLKGRDIEKFRNGRPELSDHNCMSHVLPNFSKLSRELDNEDRLIFIMLEVIRQDGGFSIKKAEAFASKILELKQQMERNPIKAAIEEAYDAR